MTSSAANKQRPQLDAGLSSKTPFPFLRLFNEKRLTEFMSCAPVPLANCHQVRNQFAIRAARRDQPKERLAQAGTPSEIYDPLCLHRQKAFSFLGYRQGRMPAAEKASQEVL